MAHLHLRAFRADDRSAVIKVWRSAGLVVPWNDPNADIDRKVAIDPEGFLVALLDDRIVGVVMAGYDGHRGWVNYLGVEPGHQNRGIGKALVRGAVEVLRARGCPKVNLQVRRSNRSVVEFYEGLGFREDDVLSMGLRLIEDGPP